MPRLQPQIARRPRGDGLSLAVMLSFNELAWILVFALAFLLANETARAREVRGEEARLASMSARLEREKKALSQQAAVEVGIRKELLGLRGPLRRVALVVDRSGSMASEGRWEHTQQTVRLWLQHLAVEEVVLITFGDAPETYPQDGGFFRLSGRDVAESRAALVGFFARAEPGGNTNTLAALRTAYGYPGVDSILLFTDGAPDSGAGFDETMVRRIFELQAGVKRSGRDVPINVIGLGDYFDRRLAGFLNRLAHESGGTFLGR